MSYAKDWEHGLFSCFSDPGSCCLSFFLPCVSHARFMAKAMPGRDGCTWLCNCFCYMLPLHQLYFNAYHEANARKIVRGRYRIVNGSCTWCGDFFLSCFCAPCARVQAIREMDKPEVNQLALIGMSQPSVNITNVNVNNSHNNFNTNNYNGPPGVEMQRPPPPYGQGPYGQAGGPPVQQYMTPPPPATIGQPQYAQPHSPGQYLTAPASQTQYGSSPPQTPSPYMSSPSAPETPQPSYVTNQPMYASQPKNSMNVPMAMQMQPTAQAMN